MSYISDGAEYLCYVLFCQLGSWPKRAYKSTKNRNKKYFERLPPRKVKAKRHIEENTLLHYHCDSDEHSDDNAQQTRNEDQYERLIEVKQADSYASESHGAQDTNLFRLLVDIGAHGALQGEEAQKHHYTDHDVKNSVEQAKDLLVLLPNLNLVCDIDSIFVEVFF